MACRICGGLAYNKPYCERHILRMPQARVIRAVIEERKREVRQVRKWGARGVRLRGPRVKEILSILRFGKMTKARLSKETRIPFDLIDAYARRLGRAGLITVRQEVRGETRTWVAELPKPSARP